MNSWKMWTYLWRVTDKLFLIFKGVKAKTDIITEIAKQRMVETMITNIAHQSMSADLKDLSQMVYMILLEYDEQKLQELWGHKQMSYFLARIIINQFRSSNSPFHTIYRKYQENYVDISGLDFCDED